MLRQLGITQGLALWTLHPIDLSRVLLAVALQLLRGVPRRAARLLRLGPRLRRLVRGRARVKVRVSGVPWRKEYDADVERTDRVKRPSIDSQWRFSGGWRCGDAPPVQFS